MLTLVVGERSSKLALYKTATANITNSIVIVLYFKTCSPDIVQRLF